MSPLFGDAPRMYEALPGTGFRTAVSYSGELRRIEALPRRRWVADPRVTDLLTEELRQPAGEMRLWPVQAAALRDIVLQKGAFLPIGVGQGKALISLLAAAVLEAHRPLLLVPAQLREQTLAYVVPRMKEHWKLPALRVVGYSELSLAKNARMLEELQPDLIILDECHSVAHATAGRTRRLVRYFREHPETMCVAMSGTVSSRSIRDFAHIIRWCLKEGTPVPATWNELAEWADAIDEKVPDEQRVGPGALLRFCAPGENVRQGFRRRLTETPGVVATESDKLGVSLRIVSRPLSVPQSVLRLMHSLRQTWTTPDGDLISEAVELWRHLRELALGFWYKWSVPPPRDWFDARREWKAWVRETLSHNQRKLDTELQVWNECKNDSALPAAHPWHAWKRLKDTFEPHTVAEWVDDFALQECARWLEDGGICWIEQVAFGQRLAQVSGKPYFGAGADEILSCTAPSIIASQLAHSEGKNLQRYSRCLITSMPASGKATEQILGRVHREGQEADEVVCEVFLHVPELRASFGQALADAKYIEDTFGNRQKLCYADLVIDNLSVLR